MARGLEAQGYKLPVQGYVVRKLVGEGQTRTQPFSLGLKSLDYFAYSTYPHLPQCHLGTGCLWKAMKEPHLGHVLLFLTSFPVL